MQKYICLPRVRSCPEVVHTHGRWCVQARGEQMLKLEGEDAIVSWPNAKETIIDQRDAYMARTLYAAATGAPLLPLPLSAPVSTVYHTY